MTVNCIDQSVALIFKCDFAYICHMEIYKLYHYWENDVHSNCNIDSIISSNLSSENTIWQVYKKQINLGQF